MLPNLPEFAVGIYGALHAGTIAVPMNVMLKRREVAFQLRDFGSRLLLAGRGCAEEAEAGAHEADAECVVVEAGGGLAELVGDVDPEQRMAEQRGSDSAVLLYTSGTTGQPKGAELSHANLRSNASVFRRILDLEPDDVVFGALPLFHAFGQTCGLHTSVATGACLSLMPRFEAGAALELIRRDRVTVFEGVPTMYAAMLNHPQHGEFQLPSLRLCVSGGGRRYRSRSCAASRPPSAVRSWRVTGSPKPLRWRASTSATARASRAPSAHRSRMSRCASSMTSAVRSRWERWVRSWSAGPMS